MSRYPLRNRNRTRAYQRLRRRILERQGYRCGECGRAGILELHHRNGDRTDDRETNLQPLCVGCHHAIHGTRPGPDRSEWRAELLRRLVPKMSN